MVTAVNGHVFHGRPIIVLLYTTLLSLSFLPSALILTLASRYAAIESARISLPPLVLPFLLTQLRPLFSQREKQLTRVGISFVERD